MIEDDTSSGTGYAPVLGGVAGAALVLGGGIVVFSRRRKHQVLDQSNDTTGTISGPLSDDLSELIARVDPEPTDTVATAAAASGMFNRLDDTLSTPLPTRAPVPLTESDDDVASLAAMFQSAAPVSGHDADDARHLADETEALAEFFSKS